MKTFSIELKRALKEKRFYFVILYLVIMSIVITLPESLPTQMDYWNTKIGLGINAVEVWKKFLESSIMIIFIPLFPVLIYCHSIVDDYKSKYINNILLKTTFKDYFKSKLFVTMILGGGCFFITSFMSYGILCCIYETSCIKSQFSFFGYNIIFNSNIMYVFFISLILFFLGCGYAAIGFLVALFTDNKMLIYSVPILGLRIYEGSLYLIGQILGKIFEVNSEQVYMSFSIYCDLGGYTSEDVIFNNLILFVIVLIAINSRFKYLNNKIING